MRPGGTPPSGSSMRKQDHCRRIDGELLDSQVETFKKDSTARGNAVQFKAWSDLCFNVHDMGGLAPEDVERLRLEIIGGCSSIQGRG